MFETVSGEVQRQYELLSILDSKASSLLGFNAIALASISIWLGHVPLNFLHLSLDMIFIVLLISCGVLLRIIWLRWASEDDDAELLNAVRASRTRAYHSAWRMSTYSVAGLVLVAVIHTVGTALSAFDICGDLCSRFYSQDVFGNIDYGG